MPGGVVTPAATGAGDPGVTTLTSPRPVAETVARLLGLLESKGLTVFEVIDHRGAAREAGLDLRDTKLVVFGSPVAGTPVMEAAPLAALDLPLKLLVWQDGAETRVSYTAPGVLAARYGLDEPLAARLAGIVPLAEALVAPD